MPVEREININPAFYDLINRQERFIRLQGGAGSGKSIAIAQYLIVQALRTDVHHRIFAFRKVGTTVRRSLFDTFIDLLTEYEMRDLWRITKNPYELISPSGSAIFLGGMDDREKIKSVKDPTLIWMEEATEFQIGRASCRERV